MKKASRVAVVVASVLSATMGAVVVGAPFAAADSAVVQVAGTQPTPSSGESSPSPVPSAPPSTQPMPSSGIPGTSSLQPVPQPSTQPSSVSTDAGSGQPSGTPSAQTCQMLNATQSTCWSGYVVQQSGFHSVTATWIVPSVPSSPDGYVSTWVGLDGDGDINLAQAGTTSQEVGGVTSYYAWWEVLPTYTSEQYLGSVNPGDVVQVTVNASGGVSSGTISDLTTNQAWSMPSVSYAGAGRTADFIQEAPSNAAGQVLPLAHYAATPFSNTRTNGGPQPLASNEAISIVQNGVQVSTPSLPAQAPYSFTAAYGSTVPPAPGARAIVSGSSATQYYTMGNHGTVYPSGNAPFFGSMSGNPLTAATSGMATSLNHQGYWLVARDGGIFSYGNATFYGSMGGQPLNAPVIAIAGTPDSHGYWMIGSDGGMFNFGDAGFYGSAGSLNLNAPMVGLASSHDGKGYWMVGADGGIFAYGDAAFYGSMGGTHLNKPIVGMAATADGKGYWLVASDGGIFAFGDATFYGSMGGTALNAPIMGMATTPTGKGYWMVGNDGGIFNFGNAAFSGSTSGDPF